MKKILLTYLIFLPTLLFSCATCQLMTPTAEIHLAFKTSDKKLNNVNIVWFFSDMYTQELTYQYDKNDNNQLDHDELQTIINAKLDYLKPKDMLTTIQYSKDEDSHDVLKPKFEDYKIKVVDGHLIFSYDAKIDIAIDDDSILGFSFEDDEGFFNFVVTKVDIETDNLFFDANNYLFTSSIFFNYTQKSETSKEKDTSPVTKKAEKTNSAVQNAELNTTVEKTTQENLLEESITKIKSLFESIEDEKNPLSYLLLLFFAYIYGIIHALGPGHGKTLVASYFLSNERSYSKAASISLAIGVVHTFSAFLLTLVIYYAVESFLAQFMQNTVFYTTKISAIIIIGIAIYLLYKKYITYKKLAEISKDPFFTFSDTPHIATCGCASCKVDKNSTDVGLIISAGIIPCPGTITIFIFSLSLGLFYAGFISAFVMSLGMSTIIFFSALFSVFVRKKALKSNENLKKYLEFISLGVILILGLFLLLA